MTEHTISIFEKKRQVYIPTYSLNPAKKKNPLEQIWAAQEHLTVHPIAAATVANMNATTDIITSIDTGIVVAIAPHTEAKATMGEAQHSSIRKVK